MAITWKNISAPNFSGGNALLTSANQQITEGIAGLGQAVSNFGTVVKDKNTNQLLEQLNAANTQADVEKLASSGQFSLESLRAKNVDTNTILNAFNERKQSVADEELKAITYENEISSALFNKNNRETTEKLNTLTMKNQLAAAEAMPDQVAKENKRNQIKDNMLQTDYQRGIDRAISDDTATAYGSAYAQTADPAIQTAILKGAFKDPNVKDKTVFNPLVQALTTQVEAEFLQADQVSTGTGDYVDYSQTKQLYDEQIESIKKSTALSPLEGVTIPDVIFEFVKGPGKDNLGPSLAGYSPYGVNEKDITNIVNEIKKDIKTSKEFTSDDLSPAAVKYALKNFKQFNKIGGNRAFRAEIIEAMKLQKEENLMQVTREQLIRDRDNLDSRFQSEMNDEIKKRVIDQIFPKARLPQN